MVEVNGISDSELHDCFGLSSFKMSAWDPTRPPRSCDGTVSEVGDHDGVGGDRDRCLDRWRASSPNDDHCRPSLSRDGCSVSRADCGGDSDARTSDVGDGGDAVHELCGEVSESDA